MLICFVLDISFRFLPPRLITFRAWESMTLFATGSGPFVPNTVYSSARSYGDLASLGNLPSLRQYRSEVFTTDAAGYRNRREAPRPFSGILIVGDSFSASTGVADEQTLSEQLGNISGRSIYNGGMTPSLWPLLQDLRMTSGLVVWEQSERAGLPQTPLSSSQPDHGWKSRLADRIIGPERTEALRRLNKRAGALWRYSPLQILFGRAVKLLQNAEIFPNPYRHEVVTGKLRNGREILFLPTELENYEQDRQTDPKFFIQLKTELQNKGIGLLVLLVPDKYVVYHDLLSPVSTRPERRPFLDVVEQRLADANIPVVNLTPRFRKQAQMLLAYDEYLYWLDDTHWNAEGIREAAQAIAESRSVSQCPCR